MTFLFSLHRVIVFVGTEVTKWGCALGRTGTAMLAWTASAGLLSSVTCSLKQTHDVIVKKTRVHANDCMTLIFLFVYDCLQNQVESDGIKLIRNYVNKMNDSHS